MIKVDIKIFLFFSFFLLFYNIKSQDAKKIDFKIRDTLFINKPVIVDLIGEKFIILTNVDNINNVLNLIDTSNLKKSYRKIKRKFKYKYFFHPLRANAIFLHSDNRKYLLPSKLQYHKIYYYKNNNIKISEMNPGYLLEFDYNKKAQYHNSSENPFNRKYFLFGSTKYGVLFYPPVPAYKYFATPISKQKFENPFYPAHKQIFEK